MGPMLPASMRSYRVTIGPTGRAFNKLPLSYDHHSSFPFFLIFVLSLYCWSRIHLSNPPKASLYASERPTGACAARPSGEIESEGRLLRVSLWQQEGPVAKKRTLRWVLRSLVCVQDPPYHHIYPS